MVTVYLRQSRGYSKTLKEAHDHACVHAPFGEFISLKVIIE